MTEIPPVPQDPPAETPPERWACVEIFGHRKHYGRISEVEQFGTKMLRVDVPQGQSSDDKFDTFYYGGGSIFSVTPMTEAAARKWAEYYAPRPAQLLDRLPPPAPSEPGFVDDDTAGVDFDG